MKLPLIVVGLVVTLFAPSIQAQDPTVLEFEVPLNISGIRDGIQLDVLCLVWDLKKDYEGTVDVPLTNHGFQGTLVVRVDMGSYDKILEKYKDPSATYFCELRFKAGKAGFIADPKVPVTRSYTGFFKDVPTGTGTSPRLPITSAPGMKKVK